MIQINAIKKNWFFFLIILFSISLNSQELKKEKIYLLFKENDGKYDKSLGKKFVDHKGVNFNLYKHYFTSFNKMRIDTLCISKLSSYKITDETNLKEIERKWRAENKEYFANYHKKHGIPAPPVDRNDIFDIYIIEKINDKQIILYQAKFRNEGIIE